MGRNCGSEDLDGVDLNRNYDFAHSANPFGSSTDPCDWNYRGKAPFSEPEIRQVKNFLEKTQEGLSVKVSLNFHSYGNMLIYPFSHTERYIATDYILGNSDK